MSGERIKRKVVWENSGVSEIIGTILMLSITVVLFSGIITMVGTMPAPKQNFVVDLKCSVQPLNPANWSHGVYFRILHQGGQVMDDMWIEIYITVDSSMVIKGVNDGLVDKNGDDKWSVGEYWQYSIHQTDAPTLNSTTKFSITIIDMERNTLVWHETLGEGQNFFRPIIKRLWIDSDLATADVDDPGPIGFETSFKIYAEIVDPEGFDVNNGLDVNNLWVNLSTIYGPLASPVQLLDVVDSRDAVGDNIYVAVTDGPPRMSVGYYWFKFNATDNSGQFSERLEKFPVGMIVGERPQIVVKGNNPNTGKYEYITFSNDEPTNGDTITISSTVLNLGGAGAYVDVWFYLDVEHPDNRINPDRTGDGIPDPVTILVPQVGQQDAHTPWIASPGGLHTIIVNASINYSYHPTYFYDPDLTDNVNQTQISVMPKILLVDDDGYQNDLSTGDTVSFMRASLEATDFEYDFVTVGSGDGPGYDYGDYPMKNYDVVIWMTGYREVKTLTYSNVGTLATRTDDVANLQKFLTGSPTGTVQPGLNGGSLWLISEGFWTEAATNPPLLTFASDYLHIPNFPTSYAALPDLYGNLTHPVTDYFALNPIKTEERIPGTGPVFSWLFGEISDPTRIALNDSAASRVYALTYDSDDYLGDEVLDSRMLVQNWGFSRITDTATQAQYAFKAIMWLGKISTKFTQDVAISSQTIEPEIIFYKQQVTIKFIIRNNGLENYTTADNLYYLLRIIDMNGDDAVIPYLQRIDFLGAGANNTLELLYNWTPQEIGYHRISIKVDPYNYIQESNELNNEISSYWGTGSLNVLYRLLIVDDDDSPNNLGANANETLALTSAMDYLEYQYEMYVVGPGEDGPAYTDGGNKTALNEYNAVIWVTGDSLDPLTINDRVNITSYMELGGSFWLIGNGLWTLTDEIVDLLFERDYLKINSVSGDVDMATPLRGVTGDYISHGMEYANTGDPNADALVPVPGATGFTYQNAAMTRFNSVRYAGVTPSNTTVQYRTATTAWSLSSLSTNDSRAEFVFMMLRWFDKPESRIEIRVSNVDLWISDSHPQLGSGYVVQVQVQNTGGATGNVLVRFMDGNTQIGSDSISVSPGGTTTAEIIWVPLFAGQRTMQVLLDPIAEVPEIFEWSNNNATRSVYVYFFWDDMEKGASKWAHGSTALLINGEEAIEYFYDTALNTNILTDWDENHSSNITTIMDIGFYHSYDTAYWFQEPAGAETVYRVPMDVVLIMDTSATIAATDLNNSKAAAKNFISLLNNTDRVSLFQLTSDYEAEPVPFLRTGLSFATTAYKDFCHVMIDGWNASGHTPLWDAAGSAISYMSGTPRASGIAGINYAQVVILLTNDHDQNATGGYEMGSKLYCPGALPLETYGLYTWGGPTGFAGNTWGQSFTYADQGGSDMDVQRYTSLGLEWENLAHQTRNGMLKPPVVMYTIGLKLYPNDPVNTNYKLTTDYDLSRLAITSSQMGITGRHYQVLFSANLTNVYNNILWQITTQLSGDNQTRASTPLPTPMATSTYNYVGVTTAMANPKAWYCDVDDSTSAELTTPNNNPGVELTNVQYTAVSVSDDSRYSAPAAGAQDEVFIKSRMIITEPAAEILQLDFTFEVQSATNNPAFQIFAYRRTTSTWIQVGTNGVGTKDVDFMFTRTMNTNVADYISGTGEILWGCYHTTANVGMLVDLIQLSVRHGTPPDLPTFVSHGTNTTAMGGVTAYERPSLNWNYSDNQSDPQQGFIVNVYNDATDNLVWTSNIVTSSDLNVTVGIDLTNGNTYYWTCQVSDDSGWSGTGGGKGIWWFVINASINMPPVPPFNPYPGMNQGGVPVVVTMMWECTDPDITDTLTYSLYLDTVNPPVSLVESTLLTNSSVRTLNANTVYYWRVLASDGINAPVSSEIWLFATTGDSGGGYDWSNLGKSPVGPNMNKTAVTGSMNLQNLQSAKLSFWHKYNMLAGANGGFLQVGYRGDASDGDATDWDWKYVTPSNAYTGNLRSNVWVQDSFGQRVYWCWNGISARGTFGWDYISVDLLNFVDPLYRDEVRVKFNYTQYGGGTGYGWYLDDVRVDVTRSNLFNPDASSIDIWNLTNSDSHSGSWSWSNVDPVTGLVKPGIDNYLRTTPVDLTNAKSAYLDAYVKFNFNYQSGAPPDGFRIEISSNNGVTWEAVNLGVRSGWNVSGTSSDASDGYLNDGKSYTGITDSVLAGTGTAASDGYWVGVGTLTRVNIDLSSFSGSAIIIRFRMVTCAHPSYAHYDTAYAFPDPNDAFGGFWLDDVIVAGETILT